METNAGVQHETRRSWMLMFAVLAVLVAAYWPALHAGWIWDDDSYVTQNPVIQSPRGLWLAWIPGLTWQYYPLVFDSFWLQYHLHGLNPFWFHAVNIALHGLSALLLWRLLVKLQVPGGLIAAMIFALHPVQVESVAWITERKNVLSMVFALACVLSWLRWRASAKWGWLIASTAAYLAALLSKTTAVAVPVALVALEWWQRDQRPARKKPVFALVAFFAVGIAMGLHTASVERNLVGASGAEFAKPFTERLAQASQAWWFYPSTWVWPMELVFIPPPFAQGANGWVPWLALAGIASVCVFTVALAMRGRRGALALLAIYCAGIFPALGFINVFPLRFSPVADHFGYVAGVAVCIALGWTIAAVWHMLQARMANVRALGPSLAALLAVLLGVLTWAQCWPYQDETTLWEWTLRVNPKAWIAANNLAKEELAAAERSVNEDDHAAFAEHVERANALAEQAVEAGKRKDMAALANLSEVRRLQGRLDAALALMDEAIAIEDRLGTNFWKRARIHEQLGHPEAAVADYTRATQMWPHYASHQQDLVRILVKQGQFDAALQASNALLATGQATALDVMNNASLNLETERVQAARDAFERALRMIPPETANMVLPRMTEAYLRPPHNAHSIGRGRELAERFVAQGGDKEPLSKLLLSRAMANAGDVQRASQLLAEADALLAAATPEVAAACADARTRAVNALRALGAQVPAAPPGATPPPAAPGG